jgi:hypothetical protein
MSAHSFPRLWPTSIVHDESNFALLFGIGLAAEAGAHAAGPFEPGHRRGTLAERQDGRTAPQRLPVPGGDRRGLPRGAYALRREAPRAFHRSAGRVRRARDAPERGVRRRPAARRSNHHAIDKTELHPLLDQCGLQSQVIGSTVLDPSRCRLASAPIGSLKHNAVSFPATGH